MAITTIQETVALFNLTIEATKYYELEDQSKMLSIITGLFALSGDINYEISREASLAENLDCLKKRANDFFGLDIADYPPEAVVMVSEVGLDLVKGEFIKTLNIGLPKIAPMVSWATFSKSQGDHADYRIYFLKTFFERQDTYVYGVARNGDKIDLKQVESDVKRARAISTFNTKTELGTEPVASFSAQFAISPQQKEAITDDSQAAWVALSELVYRMKTGGSSLFAEPSGSNTLEYDLVTGAKLVSASSTFLSIKESDLFGKRLFLTEPTSDLSQEFTRYVGVLESQFVEEEIFDRESWVPII